MFEPINCSNRYQLIYREKNSCLKRFKRIETV